MTTVEKIDTTRGPTVPGIQIDQTTFLGAMWSNQLFMLARDPRDAEDPRKVAADRSLQDLAEIRDDVQRLFVGAKRKNVPSYASYLVAVSKGEDGMTPPIILYSKEPLPVESNESGIGLLQVPYGMQLVALDGETQLAARHEARRMDVTTADARVPVVIVHGRGKNWARQAFHDLNVLGVRPNAALGVGMDTRDPITRITRSVEARVPFLNDRVNKSRRQLRTTDADIMTITTLRGACTTFALGIAGVKYGTKPVTLSDEDAAEVLEAAVDWFRDLTSAIGPAMEDRDAKLASAPATMAALGALGHQLIKITDQHERAVRRKQLIDSLQLVDWSRGPSWEGIAGKFTAKGAFAVGGAKETAYAVYEAIADQNSEAYRRVRSVARAA